MSSLKHGSDGFPSVHAGAAPKKKKNRRRAEAETSEDRTTVEEEQPALMKKRRMKPRIIHDVSPRVYTTHDSSSFKWVVQIYTGSPATRLRLEDATSVIMATSDMAAQSSVSCGTVESLPTAGSPCSSSGGATTPSTAKTAWISDTAASLIGRAAEKIAENDLDREGTRNMSEQSPSVSSSSLLLDPVETDCCYSALSDYTQMKQHHRFADSPDGSEPENCPLSPSLCCAQSLEPTLMEIYLQNRLSSYEQDVCWSNSFIPGDDGLLLH